MAGQAVGPDRGVEEGRHRCQVLHQPRQWGLSNRGTRRRQRWLKIMAAWDDGPFDNDDAADWVYELEGTTDLNIVRAKLGSVVESGEYLEAPLACEGVAAAEVLTICIGSGVTRITQSVDKWMLGLSDRPTSSDLELGVSAVERILGEGSELPELWEQTADEAWSSYMADLKVRLTEPSSRDVFIAAEKAGADLEAPHRVDWFYYFPTEVLARDVGGILEQDQFQVDVHASENGQWAVIASQRRIVSYNPIMRLSNVFGMFAKAKGGVLDGWGMAI